MSTPEAASVSYLGTSTVGTSTGSDFASRLRELIGSATVSAFARRVGLSEALLRKYLAGSEPSLAKANQIARAANCSLEWLATGAGFRYGRAELVDMGALEVAIRLTLRIVNAQDLSIVDDKAMKLVVALYQYLRATKQGDGNFDLMGARGLGEYVAEMCGLLRRRANGDEATP